MLHGLIGLVIEHPKIALAIGVPIAVMFGALAVLSAVDLAQLPDQPEVLPLAEVGARAGATEDVWATVSDAVVWDCDSVREWGDQSSPRTDGALTSEDGSVLVVATFMDEVSCEEMKSGAPSGVFGTMSENRIAALVRNGFDFGRYPKASVRLDLCTSCGRGNSVGLVVLGGVLAVLALALYPLCLVARRQLDRKAH